MSDFKIGDKVKVKFDTEDIVPDGSEGEVVGVKDFKEWREYDVKFPPNVAFNDTLFHDDQIQRFMNQELERVNGLKLAVERFKEVCPGDGIGIHT